MNLAYEMYGVERDQKKGSLKKLYDQTLAQLGQDKQGIEQEQAQMMPTFMNRINAENQRGWQETQNLGKVAARTGNLGSDQLTTNQAMINTNVWNRQGDIDTERNQYKTGIMNKLFNNSQAQSRAQQDYDTGVAGADQEWAAKVAEAQRQDQTARATASRARSGGSAPSISALNRQDKLNAQDATAGALDALYRDAPNMSRAELNRAIQQMSGQWYRDGVDMKEIKQALEGVQTADEIQAEQKAAYQQKLGARPWYQRAIDAVLPGSQWG